MKESMGVKLGWTLGGLGSFLWVLALAGVMLYNGNRFGALAGLGLFALAVWYIVSFAPWRRESVSFGKLYLGLLGIILLSILVLLWLWLPNGQALKENAYCLIFLLPMSTPLFTMWKKTWKDLCGTDENTQGEKS